MERRTFLALLALPAVAALLEGCGGGDENATTGATAVRSDATRVLADPSLAGVATTSLNGFGASLYRVLAADRPGVNLVVSPVSIAFALAMTSVGARGTTLDQMLETLEVVDPVGIHRSMNASIAQLDARTRGSGDDEVRLEITNSLWGQSDLRFEAAFLDVLAAEYGAGVQLIDFRADAEVARAAINEWVGDATAQRIPELLSEGSITDATRLALVNAIHLKAPWAVPFSRDATTDAAFTLGDGTVVQVPTMVGGGEYPYASGDGWQAVELPYAGDDLAMVVFLPEEGFLELFESIFLVTDATQYFESRPVSLRLPQWDTGSALSLSDMLSTMGMPTAFSDDADFTGITTGTSLSIGTVVHQANITVDEDGTEAAAATAVEISTTAAPDEVEPIDFVVDRPFVFVVRDRPTGAVLFLGRVADPLE